MTSAIAVLYIVKAVILTLLYKAGIRYWRRRKVEKKESFPLEIPLEALSDIWLRYNDDPISRDLKARSDIKKKNKAKAKNEDKVANMFTPKEEDVEAEKEHRSPGLEEKSDKPTGEKDGEQPASVGERLYGLGDIRTPSLKSLAKDLEPYFDEFIEQHALDLFFVLVKELDAHSKCPSVVVNKEKGLDDAELMDLYDVRDHLAQITLADHSVRVTREMLLIAADVYTSYVERMPQVAVTALAHDLGKVPERYDSGAYNTHQHAYISAMRLMELYGETMTEGEEIYWINEAEKAIRTHHEQSRSQFTNMLKEADQAARRKELENFTSQYKEIEIEKWFDPEVFLKNIAVHVNVLRNRKWDALSFRGLVYVKQGLIYKVAKKMCSEAKALDLTFVYKSERDNAVRRVVNALREKDYVSDILVPGHHWMQIAVRTSASKRVEKVVPLRGDKFKDYAQFENRKFGYLETIKEIRNL